MWKDVKGFEGLYQISSCGCIKSIIRVKDRVLKPCVVGKGYLAVSLRKNNQTYRKYIHQLVCESFCGESTKENKVVNHIDGNKLNNHFTNLEWCSYSSNNKHAYDTGLKNRGEGFYNARLSEADVIQIRKIGKIGTYQEIADCYGVSKATVRDVLMGRTWKHI